MRTYCIGTFGTCIIYIYINDVKFRCRFHVFAICCVNMNLCFVKKTKQISFNLYKWIIRHIFGFLSPFRLFEILLDLFSTTQLLVYHHQSSSTIIRSQDKTCGKMSSCLIRLSFRHQIFINQLDYTSLILTYNIFQIQLLKFFECLLFAFFQTINGLD